MVHARDVEQKSEIWYSVLKPVTGFISLGTGFQTMTRNALSLEATGRRVNS